MLEILTLGAGLLAGPVPITVDLGSPPAPAELRLDGRTACSVTPRQPSCTVDFGPGPRVHVVEAVRTDASGRVVERAVRRYNLPGSTEAEARIHADCARTLDSCALALGWAHVRRLAPSSRRLFVGGAEIALGDSLSVTVPLPAGRPPVATFDLTFPDGRRASKALVLGREASATTETSVLAVPHAESASRPAEKMAAAFRSQGLSVLAVEPGQADVVFVVDPSAIRHLRWLFRGTTVNMRTQVVTATQRLSAIDRITAVVPSSSLARFVAHATDPREEDVGAENAALKGWYAGMTWLQKVLAGSEAAADGGRRVSDAVATSALVAASASRRRAVVLVLGDAKEDTSTFRPAGAQAYLDEVRVPLVVWRVGRSRTTEWPDGTSIRNVVDLSRAVSDLAVLVESQRIVWLESEFFPGWLKADGAVSAP